MDLIESRDGSSGPRQRWSRWSPGRRAAAGAVVVLVVVTVVALVADRARAWFDERALRDRVALAAELGVDASSTAWTPSGRGRLDYSLVVRNLAPRALRVTQVRGEHEGLRLLGRPLDATPMPPGAVVHVPLSVELDCRRYGSKGPDAAVRTSVSVVAASGRSADVSTVVRQAGPLTGVARMLCALDPELHVEELSGPVSSSTAASPPMFSRLARRADVRRTTSVVLMSAPPGALSTRIVRHVPAGGGEHPWPL